MHLTGSNLILSWQNFITQKEIAFLTFFCFLKKYFYEKLLSHMKQLSLTYEIMTIMKLIATKMYHSVAQAFLSFLIFRNSLVFWCFEPSTNVIPWNLFKGYATLKRWLKIFKGFRVGNFFNSCLRKDKAQVLWNVFLRCNVPISSPE